MTSKTTRKEDERKKPILYRDIMKVAEYFLFDPTEDYLKPPFQGFRLVDGEYVPIEPVMGRCPAPCSGCTWNVRGGPEALRPRHGTMTADSTRAAEAKVSGRGRT